MMKVHDLQEMKTYTPTQYGVSDSIETCQTGSILPA